MKLIFCEHNESDRLYATSYGIEEISENAHWGKGSRNVYILHYVLSGEGYYNGIKVKEGQGFYIVPGQIHEYHSSAKKPWQYFWVYINGVDTDNVCKKHISIDEHGIFDYEFKNELKQFTGRFFSTYKTISYPKSMGVFWMLMSCHEKQGNITGNRYVLEAKKYMELNYHRQLGVVEAANILHISDRYLYNLFVKHEGVSPKKYLNNLRIGKACDMLQNTSMSVTEISVSVGFEDVLSFSKFFKKNMNVSPTKYREKNFKSVLA